MAETWGSIPLILSGFIILLIGGLVTPSLEQAGILPSGISLFVIVFGLIVMAVAILSLRSSE